jgi:hypothetical protein
MKWNLQNIINGNEKPRNTGIQLAVKWKLKLKNVSRDTQNFFLIIVI